jgi:capsular exopolysaccharide synthesis family protein
MSEAASTKLIPASPPPPPASRGWGDEPRLELPHSPLERPLAAIRRYRYLLAAVVVLAILGGVVVTRLTKPQYEVRATIWIASETPLADKTGPIRSHELLNSEAWVELLRSYRISDAVVRKLSLYVKPDRDADSVYFRGFSIADRFLPGTYTLKVQRGQQWNLTHDKAAINESGSASDSIGRRQGLRWRIAPDQFAKMDDRSVTFTVSTPRETSVELMQRLTARLPEKSNFLWLTLQDPNPELASRTLNTWVYEYVAVAGDLKKRNMVEFANILSGQLQFAEMSLKVAETALERFRVHTITLPAEGGPVAAGVEMTRDPALKSFFEQKIEYDNLHHDRDALERVIASAKNGTAPMEGVLLIPSVASSPGGEQLRETFRQLYQKQAELTAARQIYTDEYPAVRDMARAVDNLRKQVIPQLAGQLLAQLNTRETEYQGRIAGASQELQTIPTRTIEEMRLRRAVTVAEGLYTTLKSRYAEAKLAEAGAQPDVTVLDSAIAPLKPTKNTVPRIMLVAIGGGLALALGLAILLDTVDRRIRYPDQASHELGLPITATVPRLPKGGISKQSPEQISQLIESFRTLRMNILSASGNRVVLTVSSPSPGDGKSFISSNLAMSFADAGFKTLLVDGDTRRGSLHETFGLPRTAGLTEFLARESDQNAIVHTTDHENLFVIPSGNHRRRSPELLTSPALGQLVTSLRSRFDAIIFDTPPFAAGIDGYAIAAATGSLLVVLRIGQTERRMAAAKLALVDRLPISVLGAVLNAVPSDGEYEYYGYVPGYATVDQAPGQQVARV